MRLDCPVETYTDNYVEYTHQWSRAEIRKYQGRGNDALVETLQTKIINMHVRNLQGVVYTDPKSISIEMIDSLQWEVFQWFVYTPSVAVNAIIDLGEAFRRRLLGISEESQDSSTPSPTPSTPTS